jgi:hypothetical protein
MVTDGIFTETYEQDATPSATPITWATELIDALEAMSIENIKDYQREIGFYAGLKERARNQRTAENIGLIITMTRYKSEENHEDVIKYRGWKKKIIGV